MAQRTSSNHYLSLVIPSFHGHANAPAFRPYLGRDDEWGNVTYREVEQYIAAARIHWERTLNPLGLKPLDVVGCWLTGRKFSDLLNTLALSSLGYTPQLFGSGDFQNVTVIFDLLYTSGGKVLILDSAHLALAQASNATIPVPHFPPLGEQDFALAIEKNDLLTLEVESLPAVGPDDLAIMFHSSGTTGGMPKIIPNTYKMMHAVITGKLFTDLPQEENPKQITVNTIGSVAHIAAFHVFCGAMYVGACMAQTSSVAISQSEFLGLWRVCGLTHLAIFATFLSNLIRDAQTDPTVKEALQDLQWITHTGVALNKEDEEWAHQQSIRIITAYSTTETGPLLRSHPGSDASARLLRPLPGANPVFIPYISSEGDSDARLFECVVPGDADDCPPPAFRGEDGNYHTNDLFELIEEPNGYAYRGRAGDWIKTADGFVDTKTIEDMVRKSCVDSVHDAVVLGIGRPFPCLAIEAKLAGLDATGQSDIAKTVVERLKETSARLFPHERIEDLKRVIVVEQGVFVRTQQKGNVRRPLTEAKLAKEMEGVYA